MRVCNPKPLSCDYCYTLQLPYEPVIYVVAGLTPATNVYLFVTDKFGNQYTDLVTIQIDGSIPIDTANYPAGMFNPFSSWFDIYVSSDSGGYVIVPMLNDGHVVARKVVFR